MSFMTLFSSADMEYMPGSPDSSAIDESLDSSSLTFWSNWLYESTSLVKSFTLTSELILFYFLIIYSSKISSSYSISYALGLLVSSYILALFSNIGRSISSILSTLSLLIWLLVGKFGKIFLKNSRRPVFVLFDLRLSRFYGVACAIMVSSYFFFYSL